MKKQMALMMLEGLDWATLKKTTYMLVLLTATVSH